VFDGVVGGPFFVTERSALALTSVEAVDELLPGVGSGVEEVTVAVLLIEEPFGVAGETLTVRENVADAPEASERMLQVMVGPVVQLNGGPTVCPSETNVVFGGSVSLHETLAAADGPAFATVME
jgi:hypothetical protein